MLEVRFYSVEEFTLDLRRWAAQGVVVERILRVTMIARRLNSVSDEFEVRAGFVTSVAVCKLLRRVGNFGHGDTQRRDELVSAGEKMMQGLREVAAQSGLEVLGGEYLTPESAS